MEPYSRVSTKYKNREIELVTRHLSSLPNRTPTHLSEYDFSTMAVFSWQVPYLSKLLNCMQNTPKVPYSRPSTKYKNREIELVTRHLSSVPNRTPTHLSEYDFTEIPFLDWQVRYPTTVVNPYAEHSVGTVLQGEYQVQKYRISLCQPSFVIRPESSSYAPTLIRLHGNHVLRLTDLRLSSNEPCWNRRHIWVIPEKV